MQQGSLTAMEIEAAALLFDLDGVLVDSHATVERTWWRWAARHGQDPAPLLRVAHGRRTRDTLREVAPHVDPVVEVAWLDAAELEDLEGVVAVAGAAELVRVLPDAVWAVVTSCGVELARRRLARAGVPVPPVMVTSEDASRGKPAPDGYLLAARRLGVEAGECIVFEDAPAGVAAGLAAGCRVVAVTTTHPSGQLRDAHAVISDLKEVQVRRDGRAILVGLTP